MFKWYLGLKVVFHKATNPEELYDPPAYFQTDPFVHHRKNDDDVWDIVKGQLEQQIDNFERNGSGWVLSQLVSLDVTLLKSTIRWGTFTKTRTVTLMKTNRKRVKREQRSLINVKLYLRYK